MKCNLFRVFSRLHRHMQCVWSLDVVHFWEWCCSLAQSVEVWKKLAKQKIVMWFTSMYVEVHLHSSLRSTLVYKKCFKKENKNSFEKIYVQQKEIMKFAWLSDAVRFSVRSSAFFHKKMMTTTHKSSSEKIYARQENHEVRLTLWCSALFRLKAVRFSSSSSKIYVPQKRNHAVR